MSKYTDSYPDMTIKECLDCLEEDFWMLADGSWVPEGSDGCDDSLLVLDSVRAKLEKIENEQA